MMTQAGFYVCLPRNDTHSNIIGILQHDVGLCAAPLKRGFHQTESSVRLRLTDAAPAIDAEVMMIPVSRVKTGAVAKMLRQRKPERGLIKLLAPIERGDP